MDRTSSELHKKRKSRRLFGIFFLLSALLHVASLLELSQLNVKSQQKEEAKQRIVKVRLVENSPAPKAPAPPSEPEASKILEAPQTPTQPPKEAEFLGQTNHSTEQETRASLKLPRDHQAKPSTKHASVAPPTPLGEALSDKAPHEGRLSIEPAPTSPPKKGPGPHPFPPPGTKGPQAYEHLLAAAQSQMATQVEAGYQDYLDDQRREGDSIDINTTEYRYIGYFTTMRKAIEMAWAYPGEAAQAGLFGKVLLQFTIEDTGTVSRIAVLDSSGHDVLDSAIVEAIKLAAPFSPLPTDFKKKNLDITGTFHYVLR